MKKLRFVLMVLVLVFAAGSVHAEEVDDDIDASVMALGRAKISMVDVLEMADGIVVEAGFDDRDKCLSLADGPLVFKLETVWNKKVRTTYIDPETGRVLSRSKSRIEYISEYRGLKKRTHKMKFELADVVTDRVLDIELEEENGLYYYNIVFMTPEGPEMKLFDPENGRLYEASKHKG